MRSLRIVHLTNSCRSDGTGITNSTTDLAVQQAAVGNVVALVCHDADDTMRALLGAHGVRLVEGVGGSVPQSLHSARAAAGLLRRADVLHVHTVRTVAIALLAAPLRYLTRSVSTIHNPHQRSVPLMYAARRVVSLSAENRGHVRRRTFGLVRPVKILNGTLGSVRFPAASEVRAEPLPSHSIVFVGALHPRKGLDVLLRAMVRVKAAVPEARLYVVGNRDNPELEALATGLGVDDVVTFVGFAKDPRTFMASAAVFVLPSRAEGFGNVLTEARSVAVPIVASRVGGIPEALSGGRAGLLVPPGDEEALARALISVLTRPDVADRFRVAGQDGLDQMRVERAESEYRAVYDTVLGRSGSGLPKAAGRLSSP